MPGSDVPRRLQLATPRSEGVAPFELRVRAPGLCVAVAELVPDAGALEMALALGRAAHRAGRPWTVLALAFGAPPSLPRGWLDEMSAVSTRVACEGVETNLGSVERAVRAHANGGAEPWLALGEPAVAALEASFELVVGAGGGQQLSFRSLRPWLPTVQLVLGAPRPSLARELVERLSRANA